MFGSGVHTTLSGKRATLPGSRCSLQDGLVRSGFASTDDSAPHPTNEQTLSTMSSRTSPLERTLNHLRAACNALGLPAGGNEEELVKRVSAHLAANAPASPEPDDADLGDSLVAARVEYEGADTMRAEAAAALQAEAEGELLVETSFNGKAAVGNRRGLDILAELAAQSTKLAAQRTALQNYREVANTQIAAMEVGIRSLSKSLH